MGFVVSSTYLIDFTDESLREAKAELRKRDRLRRMKIRRINSSFGILWRLARKGSSEVTRVLTTLAEDFRDLDVESFRYGRTQMYEYIGGDIPRLLPHIILRLFRDLHLTISGDKLKWASDWAVFQILKKELGGGKQRIQIAREYGRDKSFWTRASQNPAAKAFAEMDRMKKKLASKGKSRDSNDSMGFISDRDKITIRSSDSIRLEMLKENAQDWVIAKKVLSHQGIEKATEYLEKSGFSKKSLQKFKREADRKKSS